MDRETGRVVAIEDPVALAQAAAELLDRPDWVAHLGGQARQRALDLFGLPACVERYDTLYRRVALAVPV